MNEMNGIIASIKVDKGLAAFETIFQLIQEIFRWHCVVFAFVRA